MIAAKKKILFAGEAVRSESWISTLETHKPSQIRALHCGCFWCSGPIRSKNGAQHRSRSGGSAVERILQLQPSSSLGESCIRRGSDYGAKRLVARAMMDPSGVACLASNRRSPGPNPPQSVILPDPDSCHQDEMRRIEVKRERRPVGFRLTARAVRVCRTYVDQRKRNLADLFTDILSSDRPTDRLDSSTTYLSYRQKSFSLFFWCFDLLLFKTFYAHCLAELLAIQSSFGLDRGSQFHVSVRFLLFSRSILSILSFWCRPSFLCPASCSILAHFSLLNSRVALFTTRAVMNL